MAKRKVRPGSRAAARQGKARINKLITRLRRIENEVRKIRGGLQWIPKYF
ncbi:MAG: hypothetical protein WAP47_21090 [Candidatus Rokuibacteriota bacterium]